MNKEKDYLNHSEPPPNQLLGQRMQLRIAAAWILIPEAQFSPLLTAIKFDQYNTGMKK